MLESVGAVIGVLTALGAFAALVGVLVARFRTSADEQTLAVWKGEAEAQKARADRLEDDLKTERGRVDRLEIEVQALRELVTGRQDINELARAMASRFDRLEGLIAPQPVVTITNGGSH